MVAKVPAAGVDLDGAITINESSASVDFRVESNGETHALFVDASADAVCINTDTHDTGPLVVQTGNTHATAMTVQSTGHTQIMLKDTDASSNDKYWGLQVSGGDFNILTCDDDKASNFLTPISIGQAGAVTKPLQPSFRVLSADMNNVTRNQYNTVTFNSELFDIGSNFNTSTYTFTAPVTGKYMLCAQILFQDLDGAGGDYIGVRLETSNHGYWDHLYTVSGLDSDINYYPVQIANVYDMDASDTAYVRFYVNGGSGDQVDVNSGATVFSGILIG